MKKIFLLPLLAFLLTSCTSARPATTARLMANPLFAERYEDELVARMTEFDIRKDPALKDARMRRIIDDTRIAALAASQEIRKMIREGAIGSFVQVKEETQGTALFLGHTLYLSPDFTTYPGPSLHLLLTTVVDPRDVKFPDRTSLDLGLLLSPYGAQEYAVPETAKPETHRTAVLWDTKLERLYGFAQLAR